MGGRDRGELEIRGFAHYRNEVILDEKPYILELFVIKNEQKRLVWQIQLDMNEDAPPLTKILGEATQSGTEADAKQQFEIVLSFLQNKNVSEAEQYFRS